MALTKVLAMFPGAQPRNNQSWIKAQLYEAYLAHAESLTLNGTEVLATRVKELFHERYVGDAARVSPKGAQLLVELYEAGVLLMKTKRTGQVPDSVREYINSESAMQEAQSARIEVQAAYAHSIAHPETVKEQDFSYALLNAISWKLHGSGDCEFEVGGLRVHKSLMRFASNSGKSSDFQVRFSWNSPDGTPRELTKSSAFEGNRRNDEARDYGLPG